MAITPAYIDPQTIGSYDDLIAMVPNWLDRDDLTPQIPNYIALIEPTLNRRLRVLNMEKNELWDMGPVPYALPADFRMLRSLWIEGAPDKPLKQVTPTQTAGAVRADGGSGYTTDEEDGETEYVTDDGDMVYDTGSGSGGEPKYFYTVNRTLQVLPPPADRLQVRALYYTRIPPLSADNQTNWLLTEHPDVYVWGVLKQASIYIRDPDAISTCDAMFEQAVGEIMDASRQDKYAGGSLAPILVARQVRGARC